MLPGVAVCVQVRNTGSRRGREVVQVYASRPDSAIERPAKWLAGFVATVDADPGESVTVGILIPERAFQHWTGDGWSTEPGTFVLAAGPSSASLPLTTTIELGAKGPQLPPPGRRLHASLMNDGRRRPPLRVRACPNAAPLVRSEE